MSPVSGVVSSVDKSAPEVRRELIAGEYRGSDFGAELFSETFGKGVAVVLVIVGDVHDGITVCITNTRELRFCVFCWLGSNQCLSGNLLSVIWLQVGGGDIEIGDPVEEIRERIALCGSALVVSFDDCYCGPHVGRDETCHHYLLYLGW